MEHVNAPGRAADARYLYVAAHRRALRQARLYRSCRHRYRACGMVVREMLGDLREADLRAANGRAADLCAGLPGRSWLRRSRCRIDAPHEFCRGQRYCASLRDVRQRHIDARIDPHEMAGTLESWDLVTSQFAAKRNVLRYDTRGAGLSQKVRGALTIDTMADDLKSLMDVLGIGRQGRACRRCRGRRIAMHTAVRHPQRVAAVVAAVRLLASRRIAAPPCSAESRKWNERVCTLFLIRSTMAIRRSCAADTQRFAAFSCSVAWQ